MGHNTTILTRRRRRRSYSFRRFPRSSILRFILLLLFLWDSIHCISLYRHQIAALQVSPPPRSTKRIYIAAQHYNSARLLREHWNEALYQLVQELGIDNVFVSIYESGSYDQTQEALRELEANLEVLHIKKSIVLSKLTNRVDEIAAQPTEHGWIDTPAGVHALRRIPFLASIRNKVLEPFDILTTHGEQFDTILFLNDIAFSVEDVLRLLDTNGGDYAAACSLDFSKPPYFYDTFALRDSKGHETVMQTWPYFRSYASRYAAERFLPVPVASCWNGMVAMPAEPFLGGDHALRFRGTNDSLAKLHLEGSECCLIHADNPLSAAKGIFLNPVVQVGYNTTAYNTVHSLDAVLSPLRMYARIWQSRIMRWSTTPWFKERVVHNRVKRWEKETSEKELGEYCLVNEMQVIFERGWKHV